MKTQEMQKRMRIFFTGVGGQGTLTATTLLARTALDKNRPLLQTANPREKLESLFAVRDPLYREVADIVIDTSRQHVSTLVNRLLVRLQENPHS